MIQTVAAPISRPVVSMFAPCAFCPASTSFSCLNCGTPIRRVTLTNRSAYYCPRCQR